MTSEPCRLADVGSVGPSRAPRRAKFGFLFNHDQIHQIAHSLPIAVELARLVPSVDVVLTTTNERLREEVLHLAGCHLGGNLQFAHLEVNRPSTKLLCKATGRVIPSTKLLIYRDNLDFFRSLDVLVVAEKTSVLLKTRYGLDRLKIIHTRHGAGDRAIGFNRISAAFDHVLVAGAKIQDRLVFSAGVEANRISVVGYPKFDLFASSPASSPWPNNDRRPIVLYNPHVAPHLSSWYKMGRQVLDWFLRHDEYRLIFAPHVMLFERPLAVSIDPPRLGIPGHVAARHMHAANIHIDLGSRASTTMAYTNVADIYLGDVSSQVYEFLVRPRPCVFLDAHGFDWRNDPNFMHWTAGPVIRYVDELGTSISVAQGKHELLYREGQEALFRYTFNLEPVLSSVRAARAIANVAGLGSSAAEQTHSTDVGPSAVEEQPEGTGRDRECAL